jgi:proline dehydrogenase
MISLDNTECAFAYKTTAELKKANFLFSMIGKPWLVKMVLSIVPLAIKWHIPFTNTLIRKTIFSQFVGGETLLDTALVAKKLEQYNVKVILDYGVEGGSDGEEGFEHSAKQFIEVIEYAATQSNIPFMSVKVTGIARLELLEKLDASMTKLEGTLMKRYSAAIELLSDEEKSEWKRVRERILRICNSAEANQISVLIDAEETWIQDPVDALTIEMMDMLNKGKVVIFNTLQLYRHDRLNFLKDMHEAAVQRGFILGAKLVRGAYMEKERERAAAMNYPSPIQPDKTSCDSDFNAAIEFCIQHLDQIYVIVATHNEQSNLFATELLRKNNYSYNHPHIHFSQLYGMSDNITFNFAREGCSVSKYLPFGPIKDVIPYLMRRAQENTSVGGQTGRELSLIKRELYRRKSK